jgi:chromosome segregation ATPase
MNIFKRKSQMDKLTSELASLRAHAEKLGSRHSTADAAFIEAKARLQHHLLEPDLDADDKTRLKLEASVATCALTRDNYAEALTTQRTKIAELETKITAERERIERVAAAEKLSNDLDAVEQALPAFWKPGAGLPTPWTRSISTMKRRRRRRSYVPHPVRSRSRARSRCRNCAPWSEPLPMARPQCRRANPSPRR